MKHNEYLFWKTVKIERFIYLHIPHFNPDIETNARTYFGHHSKLSFPVQNNFSKEGCLVLLLLDSKSKLNLNELSISAFLIEVTNQVNNFLL